MSKPGSRRGPARIVVRGRRKKQIKANARERAEEGGPVSNKWRIAFLQKLAETSNVSESAKFAGVATSRVYKVRRADAEFAGHWRAALMEGFENLKLETLCYLRSGDPGRRMDVANALKLLSLHVGTIAGDHAPADDRDEQEVLDSIDAMIDEMCERTAANEAEIARAASEDPGTADEEE